ncbi:MAG: AEC family transporter [Alphaproteobacteria bacterium]
MEIFWTIFFQIIPLFIKVLIGFIAGKFLQVDRSSIASLVFYLISPIFFFYSVATASITQSTLALPLLLYIIACFICLVFYNIGKLIWRDSTANLLAFTAGNGNAGYFGLPIVMQLFDKDYIGIYVTAMLGITLYENSLGFFITAKNNYTTRDSIKRVLKLPMLHAFILGCVVSSLHINVHPMFDTFMNNIRGCYSVLGMMLIGLGLASVTNMSIDFKFIGLSLGARFIVWPLIMFSLVLIDQNYLHIYDDNIHKILKMLSIVPLAANTVIIASLMKSHPEKAASAVLASTVLALFYVPLMIAFLIS